MIGLNASGYARGSLPFILSAVCLWATGTRGEPTAPRISRIASISNAIQLTVTSADTNNTREWASISRSANLSTNRWELLSVAPWVLNGDRLNWTDAPSTNSGSVSFYRVVLNADTDRDGLPDWWELRHFDDPTNAVAGADSDQDSWNNLQEYRRGGNPTNAWQPDTNNLLKLNVLTPLR